jgi:hypothetical protein
VGWDSAPPTKEELAASGPSDWAKAPPTAEELKAISGPVGAKETSLGNKLQTALENYGNMATLGYLPHLQALAEPVTNAIGNALTGSNVDTDSYLKSRDSNIKRIADESAANPKSALAGKAAGVVGGGLMIPTLGAETALGRIAAGAGTGAVLGGASNPGDTEGVIDPLQLGDRAKNAAVGLGAGAAGTTVAEGISAAAPAVKDYLRGIAERKAFKSLGPYARQARQAFGKGQVNDIGRTMLDNDVLSGVLPPSRDTMAERLGAAEEQSGKNLGEYVGKLEDAAGDRPDLAVNRADIAKALRDKFINPNQDIPGVAAKNQTVDGLIQQFENGSGSTLSPSQAELLKRSVGKEIKWDRLPGADIPLPEEVNRGLYGALREGAENSAQKLEDQTGQLGPVPFKDLKNTYGNLNQAKGIINLRNAKEFANRLISPSDYATGLMGAAYGAGQGEGWEGKLKGALEGASLGVVNHFARGYGNQLLAKGFDAAANSVGALGSLPGRDPGAVQMLANSITPKGGGVAPNLIKAAQANPEMLKHIQNPELREKLKELIAQQGSINDVVKQPIDDESARQHYLEGN